MCDFKKFHFMYFIRKYADCWAVHDDITGASRKLSTAEVEMVKGEFESLKDEKVLTIFTDQIRSLSSILKDNYSKDRGGPGKSTA